MRCTAFFLHIAVAAAGCRRLTSSDTVTSPTVSPTTSTSTNSAIVSTSSTAAPAQSTSFYYLSVLSSTDPNNGDYLLAPSTDGGSITFSSQPSTKFYLAADGHLMMDYNNYGVYRPGNSPYVVGASSSASSFSGSALSCTLSSDSSLSCKDSDGSSITWYDCSNTLSYTNAYICSAATGVTLQAVAAS